MKISKTLFKNFSRCDNFISYYDIYMNRTFNNVNEINEKMISKNNIEDIKKLPNDFFCDDKILEILDEMFDNITGEDLTNIINSQMESFSDIFVEVERLASEYIEKVFNQKAISSINTYEQKKFLYKEAEHFFYCYLDIYLENEETIKIFEVKATTSRKYDSYNITFNKQKIPFFKRNSNNIMIYDESNMNEMVVDGKKIDRKRIVKKSEKLFDRYSDEGKYIYDIAVERHIVENAIKNDEKLKNKNVEYYLVVLNADYHFGGKYDENNKPIYDRDKNGNDLFKIYDMNELTKRYQNGITIQRDKIIERLNNLTINSNILSKACEYKKTTQCKFCNICMKNILQDGSILEYLNKNYAFSKLDGNKRKIINVFDLINTGYYKIDDCFQYLTKIDNIIQYDCYKNNNIYINKDKIKEGLNKIKYPIYHLDFESYNSPLPRFIYERPYDQSLFQYSLHKEENPGVCDLINNHTEFLAKDHHDHRLELVEKLIKDIDLSNGGCVMVYNKSFEKTRLKELAYFFPKYKKELDNINDHIFDLLEVLRGFPDENNNKNEPHFNYYNNKLHGSFSIKKVLPIFSNLTYKELEVRNGTEAIATYGMLDRLTEKEYNDKYLALRVYCRQDTWAMVEILKGLRKLVEK